MSQDALYQDTSDEERDAVDVIVEQWRRERPDLDPGAKEVTGRIIRLASLFQQSYGDVFEPLGSERRRLRPARRLAAGRGAVRADPDRAGAAPDDDLRRDDGGDRPAGTQRASSSGSPTRPTAAAAWCGSPRPAARSSTKP